MSETMQEREALRERLHLQKLRLLQITHIGEVLMSDEQKSPTGVEAIALQAIQRYDPKAIDINLFDTVPDFGGGAMVLAEVFYAPEKEGDAKLGPHDYQVMVRNGRGMVFNDYSQALREGSRQGEIISKIASPDVVTAILTFVLVLAFIAMAFFGSAETASTQALGAALTTILGFWFGRQTK